MAFRWIGYEPYVIPSGSMIPTLLIHDHIVVSKYSYGLRVPFTKKWLIPPRTPKRGDVVVFRSVENDDFYMIKRVVGLPGDKIEFNNQGELLIDGSQLVSQDISFAPELTDENLEAPREIFDLKQETLGQVQHLILQEKSRLEEEPYVLTVPEGHIFMAGDNRDRSRDSRYWGALPIENLLGKAQFIWLSCSQTLVEQSPVCDPSQIRWNRVFQAIH